MGKEHKSDHILSPLKEHSSDHIMSLVKVHLINKYCPDPSSLNLTSSVFSSLYHVHFLLCVYYLFILFIFILFIYLEPIFTIMIQIIA